MYWIRVVSDTHIVSVHHRQVVFITQKWFWQGVLTKHGSSHLLKSFFPFKPILLKVFSVKKNCGVYTI